MPQIRNATKFFASIAIMATWCLLTILAWLPTVQMTAHAEEFCAVTLNVHFPDGSPITSTWIELIGPDGKSELLEMIGATARICDFGFGPHTLRVGTNECLPVAISNLQVVIGSPLSLDVTLNDCGYRERMRNACLLYVRTVEANGNPVSDAKVSPLAGTTDSYGRYQRLYKGTRELSVSKDGFEAATAIAQCRQNEELDITIVMRKPRR